MERKTAAILKLEQEINKTNSVAKNQELQHLFISANIYGNKLPDLHFANCPYDFVMTKLHAYCSGENINYLHTYQKGQKL